MTTEHKKNQPFTENLDQHPSSGTETKQTDEPLFSFTREDFQTVARQRLGRHLTEVEIRGVVARLSWALDWPYAVGRAIDSYQSISSYQAWRQARLARGEHGQEMDDPEEAVFELLTAGWPECYQGESGPHLCNAVHVVEGMDVEGQLHVRREWGIPVEAPEDAGLHGWKPSFPLDTFEGLNRARWHLEDLVRHGTISEEDRVRSEAFYRRMFE